MAAMKSMVSASKALGGGMDARTSSVVARAKGGPRREGRGRGLVVSAKAEGKHGGPIASKIASAGLAALIASAPISGAAIASEFDVLEAPVPETSYVVDDGGILSKAGKGAIAGKLKELEAKTGYHLNVVTMRKLQFTPDPFEFSDKVLENWYPTIEQGDKKGVLVIVSTNKEGAISGGPSFINNIGDDVLDSIISETIPKLTTEEKYNEATLKSVERISGMLQGKGDPYAPKPKKAPKQRGPTRTQQEAEGTNSFPFFAVISIALIFPLAQLILGVIYKDN